MIIVRSFLGGCIFLKIDLILYCQESKVTRRKNMKSLNEIPNFSIVDDGSTRAVKVRNGLNF